jgi:hypothetical protein
VRRKCKRELPSHSPHLRQTTHQAPKHQFQLTRPGTVTTGPSWEEPQQSESSDEEEEEEYLIDYSDDPLQDELDRIEAERSANEPPAYDAWQDPHA